jgi:hypothetical protein
MPSNIVLQVQGLSTSSASATVSSFGGYPLWMPDLTQTPFNIGIVVECSSTATTYNIEHSQDYQGYLSSDFNGWNPSSTAGTVWLANTGINGATGNTAGNYAFPVSAIRLNVVSGSSQTVTTAMLIQAGW